MIIILPLLCEYKSWHLIKQTIKCSSSSARGLPTTDSTDIKAVPSGDSMQVYLCEMWKTDDQRFAKYNFTKSSSINAILLLLSLSFSYTGSHPTFMGIVLNILSAPNHRKYKISLSYNVLKLYLHWPSTINNYGSLCLSVSKQTTTFTLSYPILKQPVFCPRLGHCQVSMCHQILQILSIVVRNDVMAWIYHRRRLRPLHPSINVVAATWKTLKRH